MKTLLIGALIVAPLGACGSSPKTPKEGGDKAAKGACAMLEREAVAKVLAGLGEGSEGLLEVTREWLGPYGKCQEHTPGGRWAFELTTFENEPGDDISYETGEETVEGSYNRIRATARAVFVTRDDRRVASDIELPRLEAIFDDEGQSYMPRFPFIDELPQVTTVDWSHTGVPQLVVQAIGGPGVVLHWTGAAIEPYGPAGVIPQINGTRDVDGDGLIDLVDDRTLELDNPGPFDEFEGVTLIALARPDGTFVLDHAATRASYREQCKGRGASPWLSGGGASDWVKNIACGRVLAGISGEAMAAALEAEVVRIDKTSIDDWNLGPEDFYAYARRELPFQRLGRDDGRVQLPIVSTRAISAEPAWQHYTFDAAMAVDGDLGTAWQPAKNAKTPWLEVVFDGPKRVTAIELANGFQRNDELGDLFPMNRRATAIKIAVDGKVFTFALAADLRGYQTFLLPDPVTTKSVRVTVTAFAEGTRWKNIAISELRVLE